MQRFHIAECVTHTSLNVALAEAFRNIRHLIREDVCIASFFGSPNLKWNGGRIMYRPYDPARTKHFIKMYNSYGIPYRFTWTNPCLTEKDLDDYDCNDLLDFADNGMNECIVYSPLLEEHIRKNHPDMKLTSSTCKCITDMADVKAELAHPYSLVVLDYNFNNNYDVLEQLTPEERKRCELLVNPVCVPGCKRRAAHYKFIGEQQRQFKEYMQRIMRLPPEERAKQQLQEWDCPYRNADIFNGDFPLWITPDLIREKYVPMGFENYKIEGRSANMALLNEMFTRYLAAEGREDEFRYKVMYHALDNIHLNML